MLDRLSPELRHLILILLVPVLGYLSAELVPAWISDPILAGLAGVVLTALIAYFTPLTRQYGVGADKEGE
jgi:hypothetical protein